MFDGTVFLISGKNDAQISGQVVNVSGQTMSVSGQVVNVSGNYVNFSGNAVSLAAPPTFVAHFDNVVPASGGIMAAMQFRSGTQNVSIKKIFINNIEPALVSGQFLRIDICRISGLYSGSTQITAVPHNPSQDNSGVSVNIQANVTGSLFPTAARSIMYTWSTMTNGWSISGSNIVTNDAYRVDPMQQTVSILPESPEMQEMRLTSGYGIILQQTLSQTGYTQVTSGRFSIMLTYCVFP